MKTYILFIVFFILSRLMSQVGVNTDSPEAALDVRSNQSGILLPRIINESSITNPNQGEIYYNVTERCFKIYKNNAWEGLNCSSFNSLISYNGISAYDISGIPGREGIAFYGEQMPVNSTITVSVNFSSPSSYRYEAIDQITGLRYEAVGFSPMGLHNIEFTNNQPTPNTTGNVQMVVKGGLNELTISPRIDILTSSGKNWVEGVDFQTVTLSDGSVWMDRNLGANRAAISINDGLAQGNVYQWGRREDGHHIVHYSGTVWNAGAGETGVTTIPQNPTSSGNQFVATPTSSTSNWMTPNNNSLWTGINAVNNPCPAGYRLPTVVESQSMLAAEGITNNSTAFSSKLKFPFANERDGSSGQVSGASQYRMWTSQGGPGAFSPFFSIYDNSATVGAGGYLHKSFGLQIRCRKD